MKVFSKATKVATVWWIVLLLTLLLTASIIDSSQIMLIASIYRKLLVLALVSVTAGTLVGDEDSNDVPAVVVGWIGAATSCSPAFSNGWLWEAAVFGMLGSWAALVVYFYAYENADRFSDWCRKIRRKAKAEDKKDVKKGKKK